MIEITLPFRGARKSLPRNYGALAIASFQDRIYFSMRLEMRMTAVRLIFSFILLILTGCERLLSDQCSDMPYSSLESTTITSFSVFDNLADSSESRPLMSSDNTTKSAALSRFLIARNRNWWAPIKGVPVGRLRVVLYEGSHRSAAFSIGSGFIEGQGCGYFFIRNLSKAEMAELSEILAFEFKFD